MDKYKAVIIGAGNMGAFFDTPDSNKVLSHAHALARDERFELLGFFDCDRLKALQASELWKCRTYPCLEAALEKAEVVCCAVPDEYHYDLLKTIIKFPQIKLVFTEKPFTQTLDQAMELKQAMAQSNILCVINYSRRFLPFYKDLKEQIKSYGSFLRGTGFYGKGLNHNGSHMIDFISFLLGTPDDLNTGQIMYDWEKADPTVDVTLFINGRPIALMGISCKVVTIFELELFFEKARIRILNGGMEVERYNIEESRNFKGYYNYILQDNIIVDYSNSLINAVDNIYGMLAENRAAECGIDDGIEVLEICDRIKRCVDEENTIICQGPGRR